MFSTVVKSVNGSSMNINNLISTNKNKAAAPPAPKATGIFSREGGHTDTWTDGASSEEKCHYNWISMWNRGIGSWFSLQ